MPMVTYPLNNIEYMAEDAELFHSTRTSGVYATNSFDYSLTGTDNTIVIGTGIAWIKNSEFAGKVVAQKQPISIDLGVPDSTYPRIDSVVIQFNANSNSTDIVVKNGKASSNPSKPNMVRTESVYELHLYHVYRKAGALAVSNSDITDLRLNAKYCGIMADSVTKIDTDAIETQVAGLISELKEDIQNVKEGSAFLFTSGGTMTGMAKFIPENGTSVVATETYRNLPANSPTASYKTRNVVAANGAAMQFYKGALGEEPTDEVNRLTLTETDTQLMKPLTVGSGGTGRTSITVGNYLVGNGAKGVVEKTPDEVLKDIGAASADDVADFATETWVKNQIAKASVAGSGVDLSGYVAKDGSTDMTGILKFKPATGTSVIAPEVYRNLPTNSPTTSYKTRNVIATNGAAMQFFKGSVGTDPSTEVNRLTLTETDTQLMKPLTISSGGTGRDLSEAPAGAVFRNASDGTGMYYTPTASGAMFATAENGTPKFGTLPVAQGGTGATKPADAITNLGINDYVVAQGKSEGWTYRKWNSGVAECWTLAKETTPTANGINSCTVPLPFEFYNQNYYANVSCYKTAAQNYANDFLVSSSSNGDGRTATSLTFKYNYSNDTFYSVGFNVHVIGRWK